MRPSLFVDPNGFLRGFEIAPRAWSLRPPAGTRRVTIRHQQIRACNLVFALTAANPDRGKLRLGIVGAGVAGITAMALAARLGWGADLPEEGENIVILERLAEVLWNLRRGHTRWLHPYRFLWPALSRSPTM